jgi:hypothetical protein
MPHSNGARERFISGLLRGSIEIRQARDGELPPSRPSSRPLRNLEKTKLHLVPSQYACGFESCVRGERCQLGAFRLAARLATTVFRLGMHPPRRPFAISFAAAPDRDGPYRRQQTPF